MSLTSRCRRRGAFDAVVAVWRRLPRSLVWWAAAAVSLCLPLKAAALDLALLSLLDDKLEILGTEAVTGTNLDQRPRESVTVPPGALNQMAMTAMVDTVLKRDASWRVLPLKLSTSPAVAGWPGETLSAGDRAEVPQAISSRLLAAGVHKMLVLAPLRAPTRITIFQQSLGTGTLRGLGFVLDRVTPLQLLGSGLNSVGYLAPYAYCRLMLIDLVNDKVVGAHRITQAYAVTPAAVGLAGGDPWETLKGDEKIEALKRLLESQIEIAVNELAADLR